MRLVVAAAAALGLALPAAAQNAPLELRPGETLLEVEAEGEHFQRPDVMTVTAGVVTTGPTAGEATGANAALAARLVEAVRREVPPRDVQTVMLRVRPQFEERDRERADHEDWRPRIVGYIATNRLEIRLRDLDRASAVLDALLAAGANDVEGPSFSLADELPARREARRLAVAAARREAEDYAAALGMRVARVMRVSERAAAVGTPYGRRLVVTGSRVSPGQPVEPGEVRSAVTVWADFALTAE